MAKFKAERNQVKGKQIWGIIALIVLVDQAIKIYVKTHFYMYESVTVFPHWFKLYFIENEGMAWGLKWGGDWGKVALTLFRLVAVCWGVFFIRKIVIKQYPKWFTLCVGLIFAGALGNLIDSLFYGLIFENSDPFMQNLATLFPKEGYAGFLHGKVVDMFYFPIIKSTFPGWVPVWGGEPFEFFAPVFNFADAAISVGIIALLLFQQKMLEGYKEPTATTTVETSASDADQHQIM